MSNSMLVGYTVKLLSVVVLYVYMWMANRKRDRDAANSGLTQEEIEKAGVESGMQDMTELENKAFRYVL
jgi:type II secretory pathway component PulM